MSNSKNQPKAAQGAAIGKETKTDVKSLVPAVAKPAQVTVIQQSPEELMAEIKALKSKLSRIPENFEEKLKFFVEKRELVKKHRQISVHKEQLLDLANSLEHDCEENDFESANHSLVISTKAGYREDEAVKISNPVVIREVVGFVIQKLNDRLEDYRMQIEA